MFTDIRYALRGLLRNPLFALTAILAAALGIGAATAVFSVVDRILFRPLPYAQPERMVSIGMMTPLDTNEFMFADSFLDLRRETARKSGPFEEVTSFQAGSYDCDLTERNPQRMQCLRLQGNFLETFGVSPLIGRSFSAEEDHPGGPAAAMISYGLWQSRFAGDPAIAGRTMPVDGAAITIVGVLPKSFEMPTLTSADVLLPLALNEATERQGRALRVFGRLQANISASRAMAQLAPYFERGMLTVPAAFRKEVHFTVRPVRDRQVGDVRLASLALFGSVLAVLLIACANIANLLLARAVARERELVMRSVLGASRGRLARQALTESLILGLAGGIAGCAMAFGLVRVLTAIAPGALPRLADAAIDLRVLLFTFAATLGSSLLFGIAPALRTPRADALAAWHAVGGRRNILRASLVTVQIAVSMVLLTGAGLLLRSLWKLQSVPLGMESEHVLTAHFTLGRQNYADDKSQLAFFQRLETRLAQLPGITVSAIADSLPPSGGRRGRPLASIDVEGRPPIPEGTGGMVVWRFVTPGYFAAIGAPILRGRGFNEQDRDPNQFAVILSDSFAHQLFPGENAIGKHILAGPEKPWTTVVGIAGDVKNNGPAGVLQPEYYLPRKFVSDYIFRNQDPTYGWRSAWVIVRSPLAAAILAGTVRDAIQSLDPTVPVETSTMEARLGEITARPRFNALLLASFAAIGTLLAATGVFGMMSFLVAQRTREIGVRMALGATPGRILTWTMKHALRWTAAGLIAGVAGSLALARVLRTLLFEVEPGDPATIGGALLLLCCIALMAAADPARRAAKLDPMETLRKD